MTNNRIKGCNYCSILLLFTAWHKSYAGMIALNQDSLTLWPWLLRQKNKYIRNILNQLKTQLKQHKTKSEDMEKYSAKPCTRSPQTPI